MSLKAFHVFFVVLSIVMALGCGVWLVRRFLDGGGTMEIVSAVVSFAIAVGLVG